MSIRMRCLKHKKLYCPPCEVCSEMQGKDRQTDRQAEDICICCRLAVCRFASQLSRAVCTTFSVGAFSQGVTGDVHGQVCRQNSLHVYLQVVAWSSETSVAKFLYLISPCPPYWGVYPFVYFYFNFPKFDLLETNIRLRICFPVTLNGKYPSHFEIPIRSSRGKCMPLVKNHLAFKQSDPVFGREIRCYTFGNISRSVLSAVRSCSVPFCHLTGLSSHLFVKLWLIISCLRCAVWHLLILSLIILWQ